MDQSTHSGKQSRTLLKVTKMCISFDPMIQLRGLYPQEIKETRKGPSDTRIFIVALLAVPMNWKLREYPSIEEQLNKLWYMNLMKYYCTIRNDERGGFRETWEVFYELIQSQVRTRRRIYTITTLKT